MARGLNSSLPSEIDLWSGVRGIRVVMNGLGSVTMRSPSLGLSSLSEAALLARIFNDLEFRLAAIEFIAFACCPGLVGMAVSGL